MKNETTARPGGRMKDLNKIWVLFLVVGILLSSCRQEDAFYSNVLRSDVYFQAYDDHKYDFLWVFDNSGSMKSRRDFVKDNMQRFINILNTRKAIDFQMAAITTDMFTHAGALVAAPNGQEVVKSAQSTNTVAEMAAIINNIQDSPTSFWEQGLESAYQAIYQSSSKFSREGVPLVIIFLTDEQDWSCKEDCWGVEPENNNNWKAFAEKRYIDYFSGFKKAESSSIYVFPVVGLDIDACEIASAGSRYMTVAKGIGGLSESLSICDADLKESYEKIATLIADRGVRFKLSSQSSGTGINVYVNGELIPFSPENYSYEEETNSVIFTGAVPKNGAVVEVLYSQKTQ